MKRWVTKFDFFYYLTLKKVTMERDDVVASIDKYDIGKIKYVSRAQGKTNINFILETDKGQYFLKKRDALGPIKLDHERLKFQHTIMGRLVSSKIPTPHLIKTREGQTFVQNGDSFYELYDFICGINYDYHNLLHLENIGQLLARLHLTLKDIELPCRERSTIGVNWEEEKYLIKFENRARKYCKKGKGDEGVIEEFMPYLKQQLINARMYLNDKSFLGNIIHGDVNKENIMFVNNEVKGLFDFDYVRYGDRIHDVAEGIIGFIVQYPQTTNKYQIDIERAKVFIDSYHKLFNLTEIEIKAIPHFLKIIWIIRGCWPWYKKKDYTKKIIKLKSFLMWLESNEKHLMERLLIG